MLCPNCGAEVDENLKYCVYCGAELNSTAEKPSEINVRQKSSFGAANVIGIIVGVIFIIIGGFQIYNAGTSISPTSFGGDFYTYTYRGIVAISEMLAEIEKILGWIIIAIGAAIDVIAIKH